MITFLELDEQGNLKELWGRSKAKDFKKVKL